MNIVFFDDEKRVNFLRLAYTRPIAKFRIGILTIEEKWEHYFSEISVKTEAYLSDKFPINTADNNLWINAQILPNAEIVEEIKKLAYSVSAAIENKDEVGGSLDVMQKHVDAFDDIMGAISKMKAPSGIEMVVPENLAEMILSKNVFIKV